MTTHSNSDTPNYHPKDEDPLWHKGERYVLGDMSTEEREKFEHEMSSNRALRMAVDDIRQSILAVRAGAVREELQGIHERRISPNNSRGSYWLGIAAGLMVLVAATFWWIMRPEANERLFAQYATTDPGLPVPMSATTDYAFFDAMVDYKSEDYRTAIRKWEPLFADEPQNDTLAYYLGSAHFNLGEYARALEYYRDLPANSEFYPRSQWYRALTFVKTGDKESLLSIRPNEDSNYADRITQLQDQME